MENGSKTYTYILEKSGETKNVRVTKLFRTICGQDGEVFGDFLFRFDAVGTCSVYDKTSGDEISSFRIDKYDLLRIHSNSVSFGNEYYDENDEFPLLYTNVYNSYQTSEDRLEGVCGVYRITRSGSVFASSLVQVIKIGFTENVLLWKSYPGKTDVRPYGNFAVDKDGSTLWAFTMRDKEKTTRYFSFALPKLKDGVYCEKYGCSVVTLEETDVRSSFDAPYSNFLQGACFADGLLYSTEGFTDSVSAPAKMQIIDVKNKEVYAVLDFYSYGMRTEPEFISVCGGRTYYADAAGNVFLLEFM